jgi:IS30 family transposase
VHRHASEPQPVARYEQGEVFGRLLGSPAAAAASIRERPASVEDRAVLGHWDGDLIGGSKNSYVATFVERHSRYVMLLKVANKDIESVVSALIRQS